MTGATKGDLDKLQTHLGAKLDRMDEKQDEHLAELNAHRLATQKEIGKLWTVIGKLTVKSGVWGAIAGLIPVVAVVIFWLMRDS